MGDFIRTLFGGGKSEQSATSTPSNYTNPILQALASPLASSLTGLTSSLTSSTNNANPNGGATPVPQAAMTDQEKALLNTIQGQVGPGTASAGWISDVLKGRYMPGGDLGNKYIGDTVNAALRPTLDALTNTLTTDLPGRFAAAGQSLQPNSPGSSGGGSSAFDRAAALAFQSASNTATDIASNIGNNAYNTGVATQGAAASLDQNEVNNTISALKASALPRLIEQNGIDQGLALFQSQVQNLLSLLQTMGAVQAPQLANTTVSHGESTTDKGIIPALFPKGV